MAISAGALAAISIGSQLLGSVASGVSNANIGHKTREFNRVEAEKARQWQEELWNKSNQFNSPLQQMQRLSEANLNPNLYYSNGASGVTAASVPSASAASTSHQNPYKDPNMGMMLAQIYMQKEQQQINREIADSTILKNEKQAEYFGSLATGQDIENDNKQNVIDIENNLRQAQEDYYVSIRNLNIGLSNLNEDKSREIQKNIELMDKYFNLAEDKWNTEKDLANKYYDLALKHNDASIKLMTAQEKYQYSEAFVNHFQAELYKHSASIAESDAKLAKAFAVYADWVGHNRARCIYWAAENEMNEFTKRHPDVEYVQESLDRRQQNQFEHEFEMLMNRSIMQVWTTAMSRGLSR